MLAAAASGSDVAIAIGRSSPAGLYLRARAAEISRDTGAASAQFGALLTQGTTDPLVLARAYRAALASGDMVLALRAAHLLAARQMLPPDARVLLALEAIKARDWQSARATVELLAQDRAFGFLAPYLRGWIAVGSGDADAIKLISGARVIPMAAPYAAEQQALALIALGRVQEGRASLGPQAAGQLPSRVADAAHGIAPLLLHLGADLARQNEVAVGMIMVRLATYAAPDDARGWLLLAQLLQRMRRADLALAAADRVSGDDPLAPAARALRIALLNDAGRRPAALVDALAAARRPSAASLDWGRVGELYMLMAQPAAAADAFAKALAMAEAAHAAPEEIWPILLQMGGALDLAGDWPRARAALLRAYALAPHDPLVLNQVGYAEIEHREDIVRAEAMIAEASRGRPDDAAITDSLGWVLHLQGKTVQAIPLLERAAAGEPGESAINEHLGDAYWAVGRYYEARYAWRAALLTAEDKDKARLASKVDIGLATSTAAP